MAAHPYNPFAYPLAAKEAELARLDAAYMEALAEIESRREALREGKGKPSDNFFHNFGALTRAQRDEHHAAARRAKELAALRETLPAEIKRHRTWRMHGMACGCDNCRGMPLSCKCATCKPPCT
jgi:hypothetical protein